MSHNRFNLKVDHTPPKFWDWKKRAIDPGPEEDAEIVLPLMLPPAYREDPPEPGAIIDVEA